MSSASKRRFPMPPPTNGDALAGHSRLHLASLDGLRGVAAIAVFLHHLGAITGLKQLYFGWGCLSVDFFFVLSGFVIAKSYEHRLANGLGWGEYMGLRLA